MRILLVEARFYPHISQALHLGADLVLKENKVSYDRLEVPGALEIPAAISLAADGYDGFVALGCVIRGETFHFEIVAQESARGLMDLSIKRSICIGNGILTVENEEQAISRADPGGENKGGDAARACLALVSLKSRFDTKP
jgi:6,7-dimethyl-8-ribityllumazine synthase